jgi:D-arginine utilization repressor
MDKSNLSNLLLIAKGISVLLYPNAEVVIHDLNTGLISAIFNNLSKREVGDESLIEEIDDCAQLPDLFPLYFKTNWDGRKMKSISMTLKDEHGKPATLLCINLDLSKWEEMHQWLLDFIQPFNHEEKPDLLFKDDWREKINVYVSDYLKNEGITLKSLTKDKKRELIHALYDEGAFQAKNAAVYIAEVLDISRATIYNYLRSKS